jgi:hypothetical protein
MEALEKQIALLERRFKRERIAHCALRVKRQSDC